MIRKIATRTDFGKRVTPQASLALDASNFFLADVRDALGPYLAVYLLTERNWDAANIGIVMSIATIAGILAQTRPVPWSMRRRPNALSWFARLCW